MIVTIYYGKLYYSRMKYAVRLVACKLVREFRALLQILLNIE